MIYPKYGAISPVSSMVSRLPKLSKVRQDTRQVPRMPGTPVSSARYLLSALRDPFTFKTGNKKTLRDFIKKRARCGGRRRAASVRVRKRQSHKGAGVFKYGKHPKARYCQGLRVFVNRDYAGALLRTDKHICPVRLRYFISAERTCDFFAVLPPQSGERLMQSVMQSVMLSVLVNDLRA